MSYLKILFYLLLATFFTSGTLAATEVICDPQQTLDGCFKKSGQRRDNNHYYQVAKNIRLELATAKTSATRASFGTPETLS